MLARQSVENCAHKKGEKRRVQKRVPPLPLAAGYLLRGPAWGRFSNSGGFCCKGGCFTQCRFQSRFADVLRVLPYCDEARFFDNDNGFVEVAEYRNGELLPRVSTPPRWLLELMERV